jgi:PST family polysaccharide transporter
MKLNAIQGNVLSLYAVQGLGILLPLVTMPFLVRHLGTSNYGVASLALAFGGYLQIFMDYGFALSATREISQNQTPREILRIHSNVIYSKILLSLVVGSMIAALVWVIPSYHKYATIHLMACVAGFLQALFPSWLYQGVEEIGRMARQSIVVRLIWVAFILIRIHHPEDLALLFFWAIPLYGFALIFAYVDIYRRHGIAIEHPDLWGITSTLKRGSSLFFSQVGVLCFNYTNTIVLGAFCDAEAVGRFSIAEKVVRAAIGMTGPVGTALFPFAARSMKNSVEQTLSMLKKVLIYGGALFLLGSIGLFVVAGTIAQYILGHQNTEVVFLIRLMSFIPLTVFIDNIYGTQILLNTGRDRMFMSVTLVTGFFALLIQLVLIPILKEQGAAMSFLFSETGILITFYLIVKRLKLDPFSRQI